MMTFSATFSDDGVYCYRSSYKWDQDLPALCFVMMNPALSGSEPGKDATIKRCIKFAKREGFGSIIVVNLYAMRSTNPNRLLTADDPEGPENVRVMAECLTPGRRVVAAWGGDNAMIGLPVSDAKTVLIKWARQGNTLYCLGLTKQGDPRHPLRVPASQAFEVFLP